MESVSPNHAVITANILAALHSQLRDREYTLYSNPFVKTVDPVYQPDVAIGCGRQQFLKDALATPILMLEVLSPTTGDFDRGRKFADDRSISTLREYLTVSQQEISQAAVRLLFGRTSCLGRPSLGINNRLP
jgi:Uma2 family endonuclease